MPHSLATCRSALSLAQPLDLLSLSYTQPTTVPHSSVQTRNLLQIWLDLSIRSFLLLCICIHWGEGGAPTEICLLISIKMVSFNAFCAQFLPPGWRGPRSSTWEMVSTLGWRGIQPGGIPDANHKLSNVGGFSPP